MSVEKSDRLFAGLRGEPGDLIPLLQKAQEEDGYISEESVGRISRFLKMSENQIYGVASFYSQFRFNEPGRHSIKVCLGTACHVAGGNRLSAAVQRELDIEPGETTSDQRFDFDFCLLPFRHSKARSQCLDRHLECIQGSLTVEAQSLGHLEFSS